MNKSEQNKYLIYISITFSTVLTVAFFLYKFFKVENIFSLIVLTILLSLILFIILKILTEKFFAKIKNENLFHETQNVEKFKSLERYEIAAKATNDTIRDWNIVTNEIYWDKGLINVFGYTENDQNNNINWWFSKIHPEDSLKISVGLYSFIEQKTEKWQDNYRLLCTDGTYKYVLDRGFIVFDDKQNVQRMIGVVQDVSKQKIEEQRLKLLETVITQTKDTVIISEIDFEKDDFLKTIYVNPAFTEMTGYSQKEVFNKSHLAFYSDQFAQNNLDDLINLMKKKEGFIYKGINHKKNGEEYWVTISMLPIKNKDEEITHWISIKRDVTLEKNREIEREQLIKELTQNNSDLKQFSYITSHNLRAPLSNLSGLLNLIEDIEIEDEELSEILDGFSKSTFLLNETINDLVKILVIKDNTSIETETIDINNTINNIQHQIKFKIEKNNALFKFDFEKAPTLIFNKSYFESILQNLMTNSLKYSSNDKQPIIEISTYKNDENTILIFSDNGIGIDLEKNKNKIFGLYQRFHDYPDSKGLGLYLVKSQIESLGSSIEIESEVGKGTTFKLTFKNL